VKGLERWAAPFAPGVINADGLRKLLGASDHDALSLLVRETIQNSWDAARDSDGSALLPGTTPYFGLSLRTLSKNQHAALSSMLGREEVRGLEGLNRVVKGDQPMVLEIIDRNTKGLGGPIDNRKEVPQGQRTDFVDLVFNIGAPQGIDFGGGTFGFGKVATYALSSASTVIIASRPLEAGGKLGRLRLIGSAIGDSYAENGLRFTGRHWWGVTVDGTVAPLEGEEADSMAAAVFDAAPDTRTTGTTIMVLDPKLSELPRHNSEATGLTPSEAVNRMVSALLWSAWPKLLRTPGDGAIPMDIEVLLEGRTVFIPNPAETHPFIGFSHALQIVRLEQSKNRRRSSSARLELPKDPRLYVTREAVAEFRTKRPDQVVGYAAVAETVNVPGTPRWEGDPLVSESMGIIGAPHHLALMRQAELVVRYDSGPQHPDSAFGASWGGAFRAESDVDADFAAAEPPTHDRWVSGGLGRPRSTYVNEGNERGPRALYERLFSTATESEADASTDIARVVRDHLGGLLDEGESPGLDRKKGSGGANGRQNRIILDKSTLRPVTDGIAIVVEFTALEGTIVKVSGGIVLAGGGIDREQSVRVLGFSHPDADQPTIQDVDTIRTDGSASAVWLLRPEGATVRVTIDEAH
jgi:hypothetical protein